MNERNELFRPDERLPGVGRVDQGPLGAGSTKGSMMRHTARSDDEHHWLSAAAVVIAVTLLAAGCSGSSSSSEILQTPVTSSTASTAETNSTAVTVRSGEPGLVQEVAGRRVFLECRGSGSPTVVLQSGFGNAGDIWSLTDTSAPAVFPALAESNRVCVYDRPGSMITTTDAGGALALADSALPGRSDPVPMPRDPAEVVTDLHDLLAAADVPSPYLLVGHSLGGALNVLYARTYPDAVSGLVVVDSPLPPTGISSARSSGRAFKSWGWTRAWRPIFSSSPTTSAGSSTTSTLRACGRTFRLSCFGVARPRWAVIRSRTASRSPRPRSMASVRRNGTRRPCGPQTFPAP